MNKQEIEFTLIQNAIDSIERAVDLLAWKDVSKDSSRLKQAILLTAHATELLLKERLRRIHPSLIWEDVDKYPRLDARTVGVDKAVSRLKSIGGIVIKDGDAELLRSLRNTRNAIEHFHWQTSRNEANLIIGQALSFAIQFAATELETDIAFLFHDDDTWDQLLNQHAAFAHAHAERLERAMASENKPVRECSHCRAMTLDISTGACSLCGHWESSPEDDIPF